MIVITEPLQTNRLLTWIITSTLLLSWTVQLYSQDIHCIYTVSFASLSARMLHHKLQETDQQTAVTILSVDTRELSPQPPPTRQLCHWHYDHRSCSLPAGHLRYPLSRHCLGIQRSLHLYNTASRCQHPSFWHTDIHLLPHASGTVCTSKLKCNSSVTYVIKLDQKLQHLTLIVANKSKKVHTPSIIKQAEPSVAKLWINVPNSTTTMVRISHSFLIYYFKSFYQFGSPWSWSCI